MQQRYIHLKAQVLSAGGSALDAAEAGVMETERDSDEHSVGLSGYPDRDGTVTLDAAIMDGRGRAGSVACVRGVAHPVALARMVMERTPHVMLVGEGAEKFARENGVAVNLPGALHPDAEAAWLKWRDSQVRLLSAPIHGTCQQKRGIHSNSCILHSMNALFKLIADAGLLPRSKCRKSLLLLRPQPRHHRHVRGRTVPASFSSNSLFACWCWTTLARWQPPAPPAALPSSLLVE
jgi:hypothetical protein